MKERDIASGLFGGPVRPEELQGDYIIRSGVPQPEPELDALFLDKIEGFPIKKVFAVDYSADLYYIPSGKPKRTHMIDARPVPRFSRDDGTAIAAVQRFAARHHCLWRVWGLPETLEALRRDGSHGCTVQGGDLVYETPECELCRKGVTVAHAITLCLLALTDIQERVHLI